MEKGGESARGLHAIRVLQNKKDFTLDSLIAAAYDSYLPWFEKPIPALIKAWDSAPAADPLKTKLDGADRASTEMGSRGGRFPPYPLRWRCSGARTSGAQVAADASGAGMPDEDYLGDKAPAEQLLQSLAEASDKLQADFGSWKTPWGEINRFQRLTGDHRAAVQ